METSIGWLLLLQVALILLNAVFACAEIAVLSVNEVKLNKMCAEGNRKAKRLSKLTAQPARFLSTIQVAITLAGFLGSAFASENFSDGLADWLISLGVAIPHGTLDTICVIIITLILSYFTLIFGELVPKRIAMKKSEQVALGISGLVTVISKLFAPIVSLLSVSTNGVLRLIGIDPNEEEEQLGEEDIRMMVDASSEHGGIDHEEKEFIQNVFEFDDLTAEEIATHRTDVDLLWMDESMDEWAETIRGTRHNRYPICEDSADNVVGILNAKEYFRLADKSRDNVMRSAVRAPYFVPETKNIDSLFAELKTTKQHIAILIDEYGGFSGIVTMEDIIEEVMGDIDDEFDEDEPEIQKVSDDTYVMDGSMDLDDIDEELDIDLESENSETIGGFILDILGEIPDEEDVGKVVEFENYRFTIDSVRDRRIEQITMQILPPRDEEDDSEEHDDSRRDGRRENHKDRKDMRKAEKMAEKE